MRNFKDIIVEKLKVSSSANVSEIDFDMLADALYTYCRNKGVNFNLEYLDYYKDLPIDKFPYFENKYSGSDVKGYIMHLDAGMVRGEYRIYLFYRRVKYKHAIYTSALNKDQFDILTNAIEPEELQEIYDYLIDHA